MADDTPSLDNLDLSNLPDISNLNLEDIPHLAAADSAVAAATATPQGQQDDSQPDAPAAPAQRLVPLPDGKKMAVPDDASEATIQKAVTNYATANKLSYNVDLPDGKKMSIPYGTPQTQVDNAVANYTKANASIIKELGKGVVRGLGDLGNTIANTVPELAEAAVSNIAQDSGHADLAASMKAMAIQNSKDSELYQKGLTKNGYQPAVASVGDVSNVHDAAAYAMGQLGEQAPAVAQFLLSYGAGAAVNTGLAASQAAVKDVLAAGGEDAAKKLLEQQATRGGLTAATGALLPQNAANVNEDIYKKTGDYDPGVAFVAGLGQTVVQNLGEVSVLKNALEAPSNGLVRSMITKTLQNAAVGGGASGASDAIGQVAAHYADPDKVKMNLEQTMNAVAAGAISMGIIGAGGHVLKHISAPSAVPDLNAPQTKNVELGEIKETNLGTDGTATPDAEPTTSAPETQPEVVPETEDLPKITRSPNPDNQPTTVGDLGGIKPQEVGQASPEAIKPTTEASGGITDDTTPKSFVYSNAQEGNERQQKIHGLLTDMANHVGLDDNLALVFNDNLNDDVANDSWVPAKTSGQYLKYLKPKLMELKSNQNALGSAARIQSQDGTTTHYISLNNLDRQSDSDVVRSLAHEMGHVITNRYASDPETATGLQKAWLSHLDSLGLNDKGISEADVIKNIASWRFKDNGDYRGGGKQAKSAFLPETEGNNAVDPDVNVQKRKYQTAFDEWMAENIARWYQSNKEPQNVVEKFFSNVAQMYRKFAESARGRNMLAHKSVDDFMNDLVARNRAGRRAEAVRNDPVGELQHLRAFHGTPHKFAKFLTDHIGSGEGAQVYGWGLYFTDKPNIAKWYRDKLASKGLFRNGEPFTISDMMAHAKDNNWMAEGAEKHDALSLRLAHKALQDHPTHAEAQNFIDARMKEAEDGELKDVWYNAGTYADLMDRMGVKNQTVKGHVYDVNLPDDNYMKWEHPVPDAQFNALNRMLGYPEEAKGKITGFQAYMKLVQLFGSAEQASRYMNDQGINGIEYRAGQFHGKTDTDGKNYVVFNHDAIAVNKVYDDDSLFENHNMQMLHDDLNKDADDQMEPQLKGKPFGGYDINPKVMPAVSALAKLKNRMTPILQGFDSNFNSDTPAGKTAALGQYATLGAALTGDLRTYGGEAFRAMMKTPDVLAPKLRQALQSKLNYSQMVDFIAKGTGAQVADVNIFGRTAAMAEAYRLYNEAKEVGGTPELMKAMRNLPQDVTDAFDTMNNYSKNLKTDLGKQGITKMSDVVQTTQDNAGAASSPDFDDVFRRANILRGETRTRKLEKAALADEAEEIRNDDTKFSKNRYAAKLAAWTLTPRYVARMSPLFAPLKLAADERRMALARYVHTLFGHDEKTGIGTRNLFELSDKQLNYVMEIADQQRKLGKKAVLDSNGNLVFYRSGPKGELVQTRLDNPELSKVYMETQNTFNNILDKHNDIIKNAMRPLFAKAGLGPDPKRSDFETYKKMLNSNGLKKKTEVTDNQMEQLEAYFDQKDHFADLKTRDYAPHQYFGKRAVKVTDKEGKQVDFFTYETDDNGKPIKHSYDAMQQRLSDSGYIGSDDYTVSPEFNLTHDYIMNQLPDKAKSIELLSQLMGSKDPALFNQVSQSLNARLGKGAFTRHYTEAKEYNGYSRDWRRSMSSYLGGASNFLGNLEYQPKITRMNARVQSRADNPNLKKYAQRFTDSISGPGDSLNFLRTLQYFYAMGFNPSSALIQLPQILTFMPATLSYATNNPFKSMALMARATKVIPMFMKPMTQMNPMKESIFDFGNHELHEKLVREGKLTQNESDLMLELHNRGALQTLLTKEFVGARTGSNEGFANQANNRFSQFASNAGFMMRTFEEGSRALQGMSAIMSLADPANRARMHKTLMENDNYYRSMQRRNAVQAPDTAYMAEFMMQKALGEFGKEGRAPFQNTALAVTALPFATYPWQMILNSYEGMSGKYGAVGRNAALFALASVGLTSGVWGLPGATLLKNMIELFIQQTLGENDDLDNIMRKHLHEFSSVIPVDKIASEGAIDALTGLAIGGRMGFDIPILTNAVKAMKGEKTLGLDDLAGAQGSILEAPVKAAQGIAQGQGILPSLAGAVPSVTLQNIYKGFVQYPNQGKMYRGLPSMLAGTAPEGAQKPDQYAGNFANEIKRGLGFKPSIQEQNEKEIDATVDAGTKYQPTLQPMGDRISNAYKQMFAATNDADREAARVKLVDEIQKMGAFLRDKKIPNGGQMVSSVLQKAQLTAVLSMQGLQGGAVYKAIKAQVRPDLQQIRELYGDKPQ